MHYSLHCQYIPAYSIINHKYVLPCSEITVRGYIGVPVHGIYLSMNEVVYCSYQYQVIVEHASVMTGHGVHVCQVDCEALLHDQM